MAVLTSLIVKGGSSSMGWERVGKKIHVLFGGIVLLKVVSSCENSLINISSHPYAYPYAHLSYPYSYLTINKYRLFIWHFFLMYYLYIKKHDQILRRYSIISYFCTIQCRKVKLLVIIIFPFIFQLTLWFKYFQCYQKLYQLMTKRVYYTMLFCGWYSVCLWLV
jgi:hypothetical protein